MVLAIVSPGHAEAGQAEASEISERYISMALQGNLRHAMVLFQDARADQMSALEVSLSAQFQSRFVGHSEPVEAASGIAFVDELIAAYREYWALSLTRQLSAAQGSKWLKHEVAELLARYYPDRSPGARPKPLDQAATALEQHNLFVSISRTGAFHDLFLWQNQSRRPYDVALTDQLYRVDAIFMDGFLSYGWRDFATFGAAPTSGWADVDAIYCVAWSYDLDSENFLVSFLKHEARHQADYQQFPDLALVDLEYRAKLTELAFARKSLRKLLTSFRSNAVNTPESAHSQANFRVIDDLGGEMNLAASVDGLDPWAAVRAESVNQAARALLAAHTRKLQTKTAPPTP